MITEYGEITLISKKNRQDCIGQPISSDDDERTIPCTIENVGRNEWNIAFQGGYEAEILCKIFTASYMGEKQAILHGTRYEIYRTYRTGDRLL